MTASAVKDSIRQKLESVRDRFEEIAGLLADPGVIADQDQFRNLSKEYARVEPVVKLFSEFESLSGDIAAAEEMAGDTDSDLRELGQEELAALTGRRENLLLDLQKSLIKDADGYKLKPVIRMVDNTEVGHISGSVDASLLSSNGCSSASVYLYSGFDATPVDINTETAPELVAPVDFTDANSFSMGFVLAGDYTLTLVCNLQDDPEAEDELDFIKSENAAVTTGYTTTVSFPL